MAIIPESKSGGGGLFDLDYSIKPPAGTYVATCVDVADDFGVVRTKFQSTETEEVDLTAFLFEFKDANGTHRIDTRPMKISGHPKAALTKFLKTWTGAPFPAGKDTKTLVGQTGLLTVMHEPRRDGNGVYANISSLLPVPPGYNPADPVAHVSEDDIPF